MTSIVPQDSRKKKPSGLKSALPGFVRVLLLVIPDAVVGWVMSKFITLGYIPLTAVVFVIALGVNLILLIKKAYPLRWMVVGLTLMAMFTIYPIIFTVWVSFTNYGEGHLITQEQAIQQLEKEKYLPEEGKAFKWTAYKSSEGEYALWLIDEEGNGYLSKPGEPLTQPLPGENGVGEFGEDGIPESIDGYQKLNAIVAATDKNLTEILFGEEGETIQVRSPSEAAELLPRFVYDPDLDAMIDQETGVAYTNLRGSFTSPSGEQLKPGFIESVGFSNFKRFFTSFTLNGPLVRIIIWTFAFAFFSLLLNFSLGLLIAVIYNDPKFPLRKLIRTLLIIPYTVPALLTILVWRGMLNPELGVITRMLESVFGWAPPWMTDQWWAKAAVLLINLWLSYPYFMLISSGSLQSIPNDYYMAAQVDGANKWQQFWKITLPLLLVAVGPLLLSSFVFNFNNFNLIYIFNAGGPPMSEDLIAGHTDILISYVYNLAFSGGTGIDYGYAAAITIIIFFIVGTITLLQFRFTRMWEEVSENV
jgi:ABC-type sugar transport system permease subunit